MNNKMMDNPFKFCIRWSVTYALSINDKVRWTNLICHIERSMKRGLEEEGTINLEELVKKTCKGC